MSSGCVAHPRTKHDKIKGGERYHLIAILVLATDDYFGAIFCCGLLRRAPDLLTFNRTCRFPRKRERVESYYATKDRITSVGAENIERFDEGRFRLRPACRIAICGALKGDQTVHHADRSACLAGCRDGFQNRPGEKTPIAHVLEPARGWPGLALGQISIDLLILSDADT